MTSETEKRTEQTIRSCAEWLEEHACELAERFSAKRSMWTIAFHAEDIEQFPRVDVRTSCERLNILSLRKNGGSEQL